MNKELDAVKQRCVVLQNSNRGMSAHLNKVSGVARALAKDYKAHKTQSRSQLAEMGQSIVSQYKPLLLGKLKVSCIGVLLYNALCAVVHQIYISFCVSCGSVEHGRRAGCGDVPLPPRNGGTQEAAQHDPRAQGQHPRVHALPSAHQEGTRAIR